MHEKMITCHYCNMINRNICIDFDHWKWQNQIYTYANVIHVNYKCSEWQDSTIGYVHSNWLFSMCALCFMVQLFYFSSLCQFSCYFCFCFFFRSIFSVTVFHAMLTFDLFMYVKFLHTLIQHRKIAAFPISAYETHIQDRDKHAI